jgi:hypothetical protein
MQAQICWYLSTILAFSPLLLKLVALIGLSLKHKSRHLLLANTNCFGEPKVSSLVSKSWNMTSSSEVFEGVYIAIYTYICIYNYINTLLKQKWLHKSVFFVLINFNPTGNSNFYCIKKDWPRGSKGRIFPPLVEPQGQYGRVIEKGSSTIK